MIREETLTDAVKVENVSSLREANLGDQVSVILYEQEMERIKYVLQSYLRTRLAKVTRSFLGIDTA